MKSNYYPDTNDNRADWWTNIRDNGAAPLTDLGFIAEDVDAITADANWAIYLYGTLRVTIEGATKTIFGFADTVTGGHDGTPKPALPAFPALPAAPAMVITCGIEERRIKWVARAKGAPNYDPAVQGAVLRIEPTGTPFDPNTYQAVIQSVTSTDSGKVRAKFAKARGNVDGMAFQGRKSGSGTWVDLGRFNSTPAILTIPITTAGQPEEWDIKGRALKRDVEIGMESMSLGVLVRG